MIKVNNEPKGKIFLVYFPSNCIRRTKESKRLENRRGLKALVPTGRHLCKEKLETIHSA